MSRSARGIRAQRQRKQARKWDDLTSVNKKGRFPARNRPFETDTHAILKPSREGLAALPE